MSTITITFQTQALDFSPLTRGKVRVMFNDGNQDIPLDLNLTLGVSTAGFFQEVAWVDGMSGEDDQQAENFKFAFNRDYSRVGNPPSNGVPQQGNLITSVVDNVVTITATKGTFSETPSDHFYDGNVLVISGFTVNNSVQTNDPVLSISKTTTGDCDTVDHTFTVTGDGQPFRLASGGSDIETGWNGSQITESLQRGKTIPYQLYNTSGELVWDTSIQGNSPFIPRKLAPGDFDVEVDSYEDGTSDLLITRVTFINFTTPLEYSLESDLNTVTGGNYQTSNAYAGIAAGEYNLFIKDVYGCEILKVISISGFQDATKNEQIRYFDIMEGQSIIFSEMPDHTALIKKNYFNTGSYNEVIGGARHRALHKFDALDNLIGTQFKSSYDYHVITLHKCDGTMVDIQPVIISQNLGAIEKLDCVLFPLTETETGVYFNGGNTYTPNTTTVLGTSIYNGTTPVWAEIGQLVFLNGSGLRITSTGYDQNRGWYFVVDLVTASEGAGTVQVTYNKHDYNTFEFYLDVSDVDDKGVIIVEKGFETGGTPLIEGNPWVSELLKKFEDTDEHLLFEWSDTKNRADIVLQSGISFSTRLKGEMVPDSDDESETAEGDSREYSIEQVRKLSFNILVEGVSFKQVMQLNIASALEGFKVNGVPLVSKSKPEKSRYDKSNLWRWEAKFGYGENLAAVQQDEIVLSVSTGVEGGGGTGFTIQPDLAPVTLMKFPDGTLVKFSDGKLIKI